MVSRRTALHGVASALLAITTGCTSEPPSTNEPATGTTSPTPSQTPPTTTHESTTEPTPAEPDNWTPAWKRSVDYDHVLALQSFDDELYATLSDEGGPSAVADVSPEDASIAWQTEFEGEAESHAYASYRPMARDQWGVTITEGSVYSVNGEGDAYDWTAVHAIDRETGDRRWTLQRDRRFAVRGTTDRLVFATGQEFYEPEHSHDYPDEPLESILYAIDVETGEVRWTDAFDGVADVAVGSDAVSVAAHDGLVALDFDGTRQWSFETAHPGRAVRATDDVVYFCTEVENDRSTVYGLDATGEGQPEWDLTAAVHEALLDGDRLYLGGDVVLALDPDGSTVWRADDHGKWFLLGPRGETLYTRSGGAATNAYELPSGDHLWSFDPPEEYGWPEAATADVAIVEGFAPGRSLYAVDRGRGEALKRYDAGRRASVFSVETLAGQAFVGTSKLTALDV